MDRQGRTLLSFLVVAVCASFVVVSAAGAVQPTAAPPQLADGIWLVHARANSGSRYCSDRLVRLTSRQGQLSRAVAFPRASAPIHNFVRLPDGSFSGATRWRGGRVGTRPLLQSYWKVFRRRGQHYPGRYWLSSSSRHSRSPSG